MPPRSLHHRLSDEDGFTIVEVLVAAVVLVVGLLGTLILVDTANTTTFQTKAREQATSLQRELIESVRAVPYEQLTPSSVASAVEGRPALNDAGASAGWSIARRGEVYTVAIGTCTVDDARDGLGAHDANTFCNPAVLDKPASGCQAELDATPSASAPARGGTSAGAAAAAACGIDANLDGTVENLTDPSATSCTSASCDKIPADYKRVVSMVRWEQGNERRSNLMVTTISNPGMSAAPAIITLEPKESTTITAPGTAFAEFTATASPEPASVIWYLDGAQKGNATSSAGAWTFTWTFGTATATPGAQPAEGELVDGTYVVGAKAFDRYGQYGSVRSKTMTVNRRRPFAPQGLRAGRNGAVVDVEWAANPEGDLRGYRVYRLAADGSATQVCALTVMLACQDTAPPADGDLRYVAVAVDFDTAGALREGDQSAITTAPHVNAPPAAPVSPTITTTEGGVKLTWGRPDPEDPNDELCAGTPYRICYFNIYRDGQLFANRYDRTPTGAQLEWTDSQRDGVAHTYYVASVDARLAESAKVLAVAP
jgi:Tfp pilus assembly protein PilV